MNTAAYESWVDFVYDRNPALAREQRARRPQLNDDFVCVAYSVCVHHPCGGETIYLDDDASIAAFKADPDRFAADYFGLTIEQYREWVTSFGTALCGAKTKLGTDCNNILPRGHQCRADEWKSRHRKSLCAVHSKAKRVGMDGS
jgi:hypothetical protein